MTLRILTAAGGATWEADLVRACRSPNTGAEVVRRCYDLDDLLAAARARVASVALVAAGLPWLDHDAVHALTRAGVGVVGVTGPDDPGAGAGQRVQGLGILHVSLGDDGMGRLLALAGAAAAAASGTPGEATRPTATGGRPGHDRWPMAEGAPPSGPAQPGGGAGPPLPSTLRTGGGTTGEPDPRTVSGTPGETDGEGTAGTPRLSTAATSAAVSTPGPVGSRGGAGPSRTIVDAPGGGPGTAGSIRAGEPPPGLEAGAAGPGGRLVAVWGPKGAPGRTTIAVNLAVEAAALGRDTLLVDADTYGGSIAPLLGLLDDCPTLAWAARLATRGELDTTRLRRDLQRTTTRGPFVLAGLPRPDLWTELRSSIWEHLLDLFRRTYPISVLDVGFCLEEDEELLYDQVRFRRNGVARESVRDADLVVAVTRADPLGVHDFVRGFRSLRELGVEATRVRVVVNQCRGGLFGGDADAQIRSVLDRYLGVEPVAYVPYDRGAVDAATMAARALAEACPSSAARQAIAGLTRDVLGLPPARAERRVRRRLTTGRAATAGGWR